MVFNFSFPIFLISNLLQLSNFYLLYPSSGNKIGDGPEAAEVKILSENLNTELQGRKLTGILIPEGSKYESLIPTIEEICFPVTVLSVWCVGKHLIFTLDNGMFMKSHLALEGKWSWKEREKPHTRLILRFGKRKLYYDDTMNFGHFYLLTENQLLTDLDKLGIDILSEEYPEEIWLENLQRTKYANKEICRVLMMQELIAGIGNYLRAEILYQAKIHPFRLVSDLSDKEKLKLLTLAKKIVRESYEMGGCTVRSYENFYFEPGRFRVRVYAQKIDPHGYEVVTQKDVDGRMVHWCPRIQK